ncbi:MAG TPA: BatA and WFA domain-containing protein [Armatimonadota bacterium]|nr:BatA and WFA domain-containing protein [Armatimonadota bacterium]
MHLLAPGALLWAIPVIAAIIVLYLFRLRRQDRRVSSLMLWGRALQEMQANAPFRRLRATWLMALQIAAALALLAALARPYRTVAGVSGRCIAVVLDASASMGATDVRPSRFERAKAETRKLIEGLGRDDELSLVVAGAPTRVAAPLTCDKSALRAALRGIAVTDCPARADEAVRLGLSLIRGRDGGRVVMLSDGGFGEIEAAGDPATVSFVRIGEDDDNVAITALDARAGPDGRPLVLAAVRNFSARERSLDLEIEADGKLVDVRRLRLAAGRELSQVFAAPAGASRVAVRLEVNDHLAADNQAHLLLAAGKQARGLLLTRGNLFLQHALALDPRVSFVRSAAPESANSGSYDLFVCDRMRPAELPARGGFVFIGAAGAGAPVTATGSVRHPQVTRWERDHPITRAVDFSELSIDRAQVAAPLDWGRPLVFARDTPLVVVGERDGVRAIYLAWDLLDSDFVLRVGFPIFVGNCIGWLTGDVGVAALANMRTGQVWALTPPASSTLELTTPGGQTTRATASGGAVALRLERVGVYEARAGAYRAVAAANLLDASESDIAPRDALNLSGARVGTAGERPQRTQEYWRWAVLAVLALFTVEWFVYHRRI